MKKFNINLVLSSLLFLTFAACNNAPTGEKVAAKEAITTKEQAEKDLTLPLISNDCIINWEGSKKIGGGHKGIISIKDGTVDLKEGALIGGKVTIDMNSIQDKELTDLEDKAELEDHLKSEDFFDVANHPTATFEITKVRKDLTKDGFIKITGNLTIKGITKSIEIPARVAMKGGQFKLKTSPFTIDRTAWDVKFHSGLMGTPKDMIINDNIGLQIMLTAEAKK